MPTWTGATNSQWGNAGNWNTGVPNAVGAVASFSATAGPAVDIFLNANSYTIGQLNLLNAVAGGFRIRNGTLILDASSGNASVNVDTTSLLEDIGAAVALQLEDITDFTINGAFTVAGPVIGVGGVNKLGAGTMTLTGANTWAGPTTITAGTLQIGAGGTTGTLGFSDVDNNGVLTFNRSDAVTVANVISGTGQLIKAGAGTLTLAGVNTYTGATTINEGVLRFSGNFTLGGASAVSIASGAALEINGSNVTVAGLTGAGDITSDGANATLTVNVASSSNTFSGSIHDGAGVVGLTKNGSGTLVLDGASNTWTGLTSILSGTLQIGAGGATGSLGPGNISLGFAGTLSINRTGSLTIGAQIFGSGGLLKQGSGTVTLTGANSYSGSTNIVSGEVRVGSGGTTGSHGTGSVSVTGTLTYDRSDSFSVGNFFNGAGTIQKLGAGTLTIAGASNFSGSISVAGGTLAISSSVNIGNAAISLQGGTSLTLASTIIAFSIRSVSGTGVVNLGGRTLSLSNQGGFSGAFVGTAGVDAIVASGSAVNLAGTGFGSWTDGVDTITINGTSGADNLVGSSQSDSITGGQGGDTLMGGGGADTLRGSEGNDVLAGGGALATVFNLLDGGDGVDTATYFDQTLSVYADLNTNAGLVNGVLSDLYVSIENLAGGLGADTLVGDANANRIDGGAGQFDDLLFGNDGNDTLIGGDHANASFNQLWGGAGVDTADYSAESRAVFVDLRAPAGHIDRGAGFVLNDLMNSMENVIGGAGSDQIIGTETDGNVLEGRAGADVLFGLGGDDTLLGGIVAAGFANQLWGGTGQDTASYTAFAATTVYADLNIFAGYLGDGSGGLVLTDLYNSIENVIGGGVADSLVGDANANVLTGRGGADLLYANTGVGFDNAVDTFVYLAFGDSNVANGYDTISNFKTGQDKIDLHAFGISAGSVTIASAGGSTVLNASVTGGTLAIAFVGANALAVGDIIF